MSHEIKKKVVLFVKSERLSSITYQSLSNAIKNLGYTIISFTRGINDNNVETLISEFHLNDLVNTSNGFIFSSGDYRLLFVNSDLSQNEKTIVLAHEIGHIVCKHVHTDQGIGFDVQDEYEANEFAHYLLNPSVSQKTATWITTHKKAVISIIVVLVLILGGTSVALTVKKQNSYYGEYYITSTGSKYHKKNCVFVKNKNDVRRLTKEEFDSGDYAPCQTCLP